MIYSKITGTGSYLPEKILSNHDLEKMFETTDEWITTRTGIKERHIVSAHQYTSDLAVEASKLAINAAGIDANKIDLIIVATTTPDKTFPSTACIVQTKLGLSLCPAFDIQAVCESSDQPGILSTHIHADGAYEKLLHVPSGVSHQKGKATIEMQGNQVFKIAVNTLDSIVDETLEMNQLEKSDIDWLVPHQANIRILEATAKKLNMSMDRVIVTIDRHGNTSAASIPLALDTAIREHKIKRGETLLMEAFGGGFTWGSALIKY